MEQIRMVGWVVFAAFCLAGCSADPAASKSPPVEVSESITPENMDDYLEALEKEIAADERRVEVRFAGE